MKSVLMIAYHYPPAGFSSGIQRTLKFSQYLGEHGWKPIVLTAHPRAYPVSRTDQLRDIPKDVIVKRAFAIDSARHLSVSGRYVSYTALPDRWASWWLGAVAAGVRLIRKHRPRVIWSTYPIATAQLIGWTLQRLSGLPWIADFRDSMTEPNYPRDPKQRRVYQWVERATMARSTRVVFTTPGAIRMYAERYPEASADQLAVIPNGYDEENFVEAERPLRSSPDRSGSKPLVLLHSGALYPNERDPRAFYRALAALARTNRLERGYLRVVLRATGHDDFHRSLVAQNDIDDIVSIESPLPYRDALREMMEVDGLLVFQASNCNHQVPAKIYEYLRARRPILALTDPKGDTAEVLRNAGIGSIAPLDDEDSIVHGLLELVSEIREGRATVASDDEISKHSRRNRTAALAAMLNEVSETGSRS